MLVLYPHFLIFKFLDGAHLFLQLRNAVLEALLLPLQSVRYLLLHSRLTIYYLVPYLVEYLRDFSSVFVSRVLQLAEVILDPVYLVLHLIFLLECSLESHVEHVLFLLAGFVQGHDLVRLVVLVQNAVYAQKLLIQVAKGFNLLVVTFTELNLG